jgi:hypothetical protein
MNKPIQCLYNTPTIFDGTLQRLYDTRGPNDKPVLWAYSQKIKF